jgi:hypothetical protein
MHLLAILYEEAKTRSWSGGARSSYAILNEIGELLSPAVAVLPSKDPRTFISQLNCFKCVEPQLVGRCGLQ